MLTPSKPKFTAEQAAQKSAIQYVAGTVPFTAEQAAQKWIK